MRNKYFRICLNSDGGDGNGGGDPAGAGGGGGGTSHSVNNPAPAGEAYKAPELDMATAIPPEYREKPYFKNIKDFTGMVKEFDNLQTLMGKRPAGIPSDNASDAERDKFYSAFRPGKAEEYELPETEFSKKNGRTPDAVKKMQEVFHNAGLSKYQAGKLTEAYESMVADAQASEAAGRQKLEQEFQTEFDKTFGDRGPEVQKTVKGLMDKFIPQHMKPYVANMPNEALLVLTATLNGVYEQYIKEDGTSFEGRRPGGADVAELQQEARTLMQSEAYKDFRHAQHDATKTKVQELYRQIAGFKPAEKK